MDLAFGEQVGAQAPPTDHRPDQWLCKEVGQILARIAESGSRAKHIADEEPTADELVQVYAAGRDVATRFSRL